MDGRQLIDAEGPGESGLPSEATLGDVLRHIRGSRGMTLRSASAATGISNVYISQVETGRIKSPSPYFLRKLAHGYGVTLDTLMRAAGYTDTAQDSTPTVLPLVLSGGSISLRTAYCDTLSYLATVTAERDAARDEVKRLMMNMHGNRAIFILSVLRDGPCQIYGSSSGYRTCHDMKISHNDFELLGHAGYIKDVTERDEEGRPTQGFEMWVLSDTGTQALQGYERGQRPMQKFRKKPIVIEAFQWQGEEVAGFYIRDQFPNGIEGEPVRMLAVPTLDSIGYASVGDYVITGIAGEHYPCKESIFLATYEPVEEAEKEA